MCSILEYGAACWEPYRDPQVTALDRALKKAVKFGSHTSDSVWETLVQCSKIGRVFAMLKAYSGQRAWKGTGDKLQGPCYLSREDKDWKRTDIGKYFFCI